MHFPSNSREQLHNTIVTPYWTNYWTAYLVYVMVSDCLEQSPVYCIEFYWFLVYKVTYSVGIK